MRKESPPVVRSPQHPDTPDPATVVATPARRRGGRTRRDQGSTPAGGPARAQTTRVLIVDDHGAFAGALAFTIDGHADLACVGTAGTLAAAASLIDELRPDVVLMDVLLPDGNGIDAVPSIVAASPGTRVLVLTGHADVAVLSRAATNGASGFLPKESPIEAVINAIRAAVSGQMLVDGPTLASILGRLTESPRPPQAAPGVPVLTRRESDVLRLMGQGQDPHAIAAGLGISLNTCRGYQKSLLAKLGAHSQLEAVVVGTRLGLLPR
jgi:DNA-binding NarL/FixJ family response regulator